MSDQSRRTMARSRCWAILKTSVLAAVNGASLGSGALAKSRFDFRGVDYGSPSAVVASEHGERPHAHDGKIHTSSHIEQRLVQPPGPTTCRCERCCQTWPPL
ncbi:hypothetical protein DFH07DRAFT_397635 [Mycena maculata]|uniref:Secreted protein n=1 Tax=Mycena maculata TaxID=230809 RepID=A0AAD7JI16_9AGAR|nr:hypothetical protein DFH07DRAFT_397635 [Mycena maculata]